MMLINVLTNRLRIINVLSRRSRGDSRNKKKCRTPNGLNLSLEH